VGVKQHLVRLGQVGPQAKGAAVAELEVGDLQLGLRFRLRLASRVSQLPNTSAYRSSLLVLFLAGYCGVTSPFAKYFLMVFRDNPVRLAISRIDSLSRPCQRRITLNKSTSITPLNLLRSCRRRRVTRGSFLDANNAA
jgi:hypothetical protein